MYLAICFAFPRVQPFFCLAQHSLLSTGAVYRGTPSTGRELSAAASRYRTFHLPSFVLRTVSFMVRSLIHAANGRPRPRRVTVNVKAVLLTRARHICCVKMTKPCVSYSSVSIATSDGVTLAARVWGQPRNEYAYPVERSF